MMRWALPANPGLNVRCRLINVTCSPSLGGRGKAVYWEAAAIPLAGVSACAACCRGHAVQRGPLGGGWLGVESQGGGGTGASRAAGLAVIKQLDAVAVPVAVKGLLLVLESQRLLCLRA